MDNLISALILAIFQGVTEWLPISSSGHIAILEKLLGYERGLLSQVALHFGTLMAVFVYFGKDILDIAKEVLFLRFKSNEGKLGLCVLIGSIPAAILGFLFFNYFDKISQNLILISLGFGLTALILFIVSFSPEKNENLSYKKSFLIGIAQALAILPGISRSGLTISSGALLGLDLKNAAKFSFLLSIPVIFGANILVIGNQRLPTELIWATLVSFLIGLISLHFMFKVVLTNKKNLRWFGFYTLILGLIIAIYYFFNYLL